MVNLIDRVAMAIEGMNTSQVETSREVAKIAVEIVLYEVLSLKQPDYSRRYCTNDEAFFGEGFDAAMTLIRALGE